MPAQARTRSESPDAPRKHQHFLSKYRYLSIRDRYLSVRYRYLATTCVKLLIGSRGPARRRSMHNKFITVATKNKQIKQICLHAIKHALKNGQHSSTTIKKTSIEIRRPITLRRRWGSKSNTWNQKTIKHHQTQLTYIKQI